MSRKNYRIRRRETRLNVDKKLHRFCRETSREQRYISATERSSSSWLSTSVTHNQGHSEWKRCLQVARNPNPIESPMLPFQDSDNPRWICGAFTKYCHKIVRSYWSYHKRSLVRSFSFPDADSSLSTLSWSYLRSSCQKIPRLRNTKTDEM